MGAKDSGLDLSANRGRGVRPKTDTTGQIEDKPSFSLFVEIKIKRGRPKDWIKEYKFSDRVLPRPNLFFPQTHRHRHYISSLDITLPTISVLLYHCERRHMVPTPDFKEESKEPRFTKIG